MQEIEAYKERGMHDSICLIQERVGADYILLNLQRVGADYKLLNLHFPFLVTNICYCVCLSLYMLQSMH